MAPNLSYIYGNYESRPEIPLRGVFSLWGLPIFLTHIRILLLYGVVPGAISPRDAIIIEFEFVFLMVLSGICVGVLRATVYRRASKIVRKITSISTCIFIGNKCTKKITDAGACEIAGGITRDITSKLQVKLQVEWQVNAKYNSRRNSK